MSEQSSYNPEQSGEHTLNLTELLEACRGVLDEDDLAFIEDCDLNEALGYAYGRLLEAGVDPDEYLQGMDVLENNG